MSIKNKVFHVLGLSCVGSAVFLMAYVFYHIVLYGGIVCVEPNVLMVACELGMTIQAVVYFGYIFNKTLRKQEEHAM